VMRFNYFYLSNTILTWTALGTKLDFRGKSLVTNSVDPGISQGQRVNGYNNICKVSAYFRGVYISSH